MPIFGTGIDARRDGCGPAALASSILANSISADALLIEGAGGLSTILWSDCIGIVCPRSWRRSSSGSDCLVILCPLFTSLSRYTRYRYTCFGGWVQN